jgi:hypothetical protein
MNPIRKIRYIETIIYTLAAGVLLALAWLGGPFFDPQRAGVLAYLLAGYAGLLLVSAMLSFYYARRGLSFTGLLAAQCRAALGMLRETASFVAQRSTERSELVLLLLVTLLGLGLRAFFMNQPMRMDESYTFLYYLNRGADPFHYTIPNNHVLHTLLAWLSVVIGGMSPVAIRFPAFLAGVLCIPLMFWVGKAFNKQAGLLAAAGMAVLPYMVLYSTAARGYSLLVLLTLCLLLVGKYYLERPAFAGCSLLALVSALGLLTMPSMLFALAGFSLWLSLSLFLQGRSPVAVVRDFLLPYGLPTALFTVIFYTPTVISSNGAGAIFSNQFVDPRSWEDFSKHLLPHLRQTLSDFSRDVPQLLEYGGLLLALAGLFAILRRRDWPAALLLPTIVLGGLAVFLARHAIPFARTWIYLIPFALLFADLGYSYLLERLRPNLRAVFGMLVFTAAAVFAGFLASSGAVARYPDTGVFPEAATVAGYLKPLMSGDEFIVVRDTANYPVFYYLCYADAPPQRADIDPATARRYFITQQGWHALGDLTDEPATPVFAFDAATVYKSTGGERPHYPAFVFDCRQTRK